MPTTRGPSTFHASTPIGQVINSLSGLMFQRAMANSPAAQAQAGLLDAQTSKATQEAEAQAQRVDARTQDNRDVLIANQANVDIPTVRAYRASMYNGTPLAIDRPRLDALRNAFGQYEGTLFATGQSKVNDIATAMNLGARNQAMEGAIGSGDYDTAARISGAYKGNPINDVKDGYQFNPYDPSTSPVAQVTATALANKRRAEGALAGERINTEKANQGLIGAKTATEGFRPSYVQALTGRQDSAAALDEQRAETEKMRPTLIDSQIGLNDSRAAAEAVRPLVLEAQRQSYLANAESKRAGGAGGNKPITPNQGEVAIALDSAFGNDVSQRSKLLDPDQRLQLLGEITQLVSDPKSPQYRNPPAAAQAVVTKYFPGGPQFESPFWGDDTLSGFQAPAGVGGPAPGVSPALPAASAAPAAPVRVLSDADYNALPSGALFIDPNGNTRQKP